MTNKRNLNIHTGCSPQHRMTTITLKLQVGFIAPLRVLISHHLFSHFIRDSTCYFRLLVHENHDTDLRTMKWISRLVVKLWLFLREKDLNRWKALCWMRRKHETWEQGRGKSKVRRGLVWFSEFSVQTSEEKQRKRSRKKRGKGITVKCRGEQQNRSSACWTWIPNQQAC